ncbi:MAG: hypothetical protein LKE54_07515 [Prevotella sp.]|nr:hypothetical protein [Prevotella sp.]MCH3994881.1 hypothetical protein [Prevotella sp.]
MTLDELQEAVAKTEIRDNESLLCLMVNNGGQHVYGTVVGKTRIMGDSLLSQMHRTDAFAAFLFKVMSAYFQTIKGDPTKIAKFNALFDAIDF